MILLDSSFTHVGVAVSEGTPGNGFFLFDRVTTSDVEIMVENVTGYTGAPPPYRFRYRYPYRYCTVLYSTVCRECIC
jgi:hypothetical protein